MGNPVFSPLREIFDDIIEDTQTAVATCELCGRVCFENKVLQNSNHLEKLKKDAEETPDKVVPMDVVRTGMIDGKTVVVNCPCNGLRKYENFIWSHRHMISSYIHARTERIASAAYDDEAEAEFLAENVARQEADKTFKKCQDCGGYFYEDAMDDRQFCPRCSTLHPVAPEPENPSYMDSNEVNLPF